MHMFVHTKKMLDSSRMTALGTDSFDISSKIICDVTSEVRDSTKVVAWSQPNQVALRSQKPVPTRISSESAVDSMNAVCQPIANKDFVQVSI